MKNNGLKIAFKRTKKEHKIIVCCSLTANEKLVNEHSKKSLSHFYEIAVPVHRGKACAKRV